MSQPLNIAQKIDAVLYYEALAEAATAKARAVRQELDTEARAEYQNNGIAPSWRSPSATVPLSMSQPDYRVSDKVAWTEWVNANRPGEIEEIVQVRPAYQKALFSTLAKYGDVPVTEDGEIIPGLEYVPGGVPKGISFRKVPGMKDAFGTIAAEAIDTLAPTFPSADDTAEGGDQ